MLSQSAGLFLSIDLFPAYAPHIGFTSISNLLNSIFDIETSNRSASILSENYNTYKYNLNITGVINSFFIAEAWANFGLIGVILSPFYVGFIIQTLYMIFLKLPKTPLLIGIFVYFTYQSGINGGINGYLYSVRIFAIFLIFFGIYFVFRRQGKR